MAESVYSAARERRRFGVPLSRGASTMDSNAYTTQLLVQSAADHSADGSAELVELVYDRLRDLARRKLAGERADHTLDPTALVNEAYVRLIDGDSVDWQGKTHFFAVAATTLRRVLVDHARARNRLRRGGDRERVSLDVAEPIQEQGPVDIVDLDNALRQLAELSPRQAKVVDLRFFADMSVRDTAAYLGVSERTVKSDWSMACAWLRRALAGRGEPR